MLKLILNKGYVDSVLDSVVIEDRRFLANVTIIISAGWTGHLVLAAWHPKVGLVIFAWGRKTTSVYFLQYRNFWLLNGTHEEGAN